MSERQKLEDAPAGFARGIEEFNEGEFFECHETLEAVWKDQKDPNRELTQGIIQIAVGYYHHKRANQVGALKLLKRGLERVQKYPPDTFGLNLGKFAEHVARNIREIGDDSGSAGGVNIPQIEIFAN